MTDLLALMAARQAGLDAGDRAAAHADRVTPGWRRRAINFVYRYARTHHQFRAEQVRAEAEARGLPLPPDRRAWGGIMRWAERMGMIVAVKKEGGIAAHGSDVTLWQSRVFEGVPA